MADILRRVAILAINRASCGNIRAMFPLHARSIFSSSGIGIDGFKTSREQHALRYAPSVDGFKKRFLDTIGQADSQVFTEDLRNMIMSANTDPEIDAVIQALKKYSANKQKFSDYHFGSPVMRLLYVQNKIDLAMQLFMDESLKDIFNDSASALVLMNRLIEDKRYDDAIKVFEFSMKRGFKTANGRTYPTDVIMLAIEGLYRQNTKASLAKAKELLAKVMEHDVDVNPRTASMTALLSIQQGEPSFAMEILDTIRVQNLQTIQNIRAICYAEMGRVEEAINVVHLLADQAAQNSDRRRVFPIVMRHIRMAVEKTKDQALTTRFEELSKSVLNNNRLSTVDLDEFLCQSIDRRVLQRSGTQRPSGDNRQRNQGNMSNSGYRNGFDQQSNNMRQGMGGGFNRQNSSYDRAGGAGRYNQSGRNDNNSFQGQDSGYDRRPQNSYVNDGYQRNNGNDRFSNRNRGSSMDSSYRQDNRFQRQDQNNSRSNRNDGNEFSSSRGRERDGDRMNSEASTRRNANTMGSKDSKGKGDDSVDATARTNRNDGGQATKRNRSSAGNDDNAHENTPKSDAESSGRSTRSSS